jgi:hypothetical protein
MELFVSLCVSYSETTRLILKVLDFILDGRTGYQLFRPWRSPGLNLQAGHDLVFQLTVHEQRRWHLIFT